MIHCKGLLAKRQSACTKEANKKQFSNERYQPSWQSASKPASPKQGNPKRKGAQGMAKGRGDPETPREPKGQGEGGARGNPRGPKGGKPEATQGSPRDERAEGRGDPSRNAWTKRC